MSKTAWPTIDPIRGAVPPSIESTLAAFTDFYRSQIGTRRLQWTLEFSRVRLKVTNLVALKEIRCSGVVAVVLLAFGHATLVSANEITHVTGINTAQVEEVLKLLMSKRNGRILVSLHQRYRLNHDVSAENGCIAIPFQFPTLPKTEDSTKSTIDNNRGSQVDAAAMLVMKHEKSIEKADLKRRIKELIAFRLDDELFEKRLEHLGQILCLKLDPSGRVHYLP
jgi:hypothetical protein